MKFPYLVYFDKSSDMIVWNRSDPTHTVKLNSSCILIVVSNGSKAFLQYVVGLGLEPSWYHGYTEDGQRVMWRRDENHKLTKLL